MSKIFGLRYIPYEPYEYRCFDGDWKYPLEGKEMAKLFFMVISRIENIKHYGLSKANNVYILGHREF